MSVTFWLCLAFFGLSSGFRVGTVHVGSGITAYTNPIANKRAEALLSQCFRVQEQSLDDAGSGQVSPAKGEYKWTELDYRIQVMRDTDATTKVMRLFSGPGWMRTNTSCLGHGCPLSPAHYQDFADLCAAAARRYPDVTHFLVWNEMDGFANPNSTFMAAEYTELYNKVYTALKAVNASVSVGGPYAPISRWQLPPGSQGEVSGAWGAISPNVLSFLRYWKQHAAGFDFVAVDGHLAYANATHSPALDPLNSTLIFPAMTTWLVNNMGGVPVWWSEFYAVPCHDYWANMDWPLSTQVAVLDKALGEVAAAGADTVMIWPAQANPNCVAGFYNDTTGPTGGYSTEFFKLAEKYNGC